MIRVYKLSCEAEVDKFYIGSTRTTIKERLRHHKQESADITKNSLLFQFIRRHGDNINIQLIEERQCDNFEAQRVFEQEIIDREKPNLNMQCAYKDPEIRKIEHKITKKKYNELHKDKISEYNIHYNATHKEKRAQYENNPDRIKYKTELINCVCGNTYTSHHKNRHMLSKRHLSKVIV